MDNWLPFEAPAVTLNVTSTSAGNSPVMKSFVPYGFKTLLVANVLISAAFISARPLPTSRNALTSVMLLGLATLFVEQQPASNSAANNGNKEAGVTKEILDIFIM